MAVTRKPRRGKICFVIEFAYHDSRTGKRVRYRRDAEVQTATAASAEERRLLAKIAQFGYLPSEEDERAEAVAVVAEIVKPPPPPEPEAKGAVRTFDDGVKLFRSTKAATQLKRTTLRGYNVSLDAYLIPRFDKVPIEEFGYTHIATLDGELRQAGLKPSSRANVIVAARSVLDCCVQAGWLPEMPRLPPLPKVGQTVVRPPHPGDVEALLAAAEPCARLALALCVDAGLRAGEVRGLEWMDVDLAGLTITVRQTIYYGEKDTPKSGHQRIIPLTARLAEMLKEAAKRPHKPEDPVAPSTRGTPWGEGSLLHALHRTIDKLKLPRARVHDLRHYFVTQCFRAGVGAPTVRDLAGHLHMQVTARYAHSDEDAKRAAIRALDGRRAS